MPNEQKCPQCGATVPSGALEGLCPACLLRQGATDDTATHGGAQPFQPPAVEEIARLFPQLHILEFIGKGGMGAVYKARQPALDRIVALKILPPQAGCGTDFAGRFNREARALAKLNHPNIVAVHEFGQVDGMPFFIMEFVDGLNLRQLERAGRLAPREALQIVPQICEALQFAHDEGIVHRDIKPENILLDKKGRVKIADFGIAKIMASGAAGSQFSDAFSHTEGKGAIDSAAITEAGKAIGTPNYMAPEQKDEPQSVDHRADIFSLGVVFYEMLTGELPVGKFAPPSRRVEVDVRLDAVVLRALEKEPERRYQQASDVKTMVETIATSALGQPHKPSQNVQPLDAKTWSPFQSPQVREICAHMTDEEKSDGVRRVMFWGIWCVVSCFAFIFGVNFSLHTETALMLGAGFVVLQILAVTTWLKMQRQFLSSTIWARQQGIEAVNLKLFSVKARVGLIRMRDGVAAPNWLGIAEAFVMVFACAFAGTLIFWLLTQRAFNLMPAIGIDVGLSMALVAGTTVRALGRGWKATLIWAYLVPLAVAGFWTLTTVQVPRVVDAVLTAPAPANIPGEQFTAMGMTLGAMRVFGADRYMYRFQIRNAAGKIVRSTDVPIPFENDKLRTDPGAAPGPVADYFFASHGHIDWAPDGSAATFSMRGVELAHLQVDRFASTVAKGAFGIVHEVAIANGNLSNSFFSLDLADYVAGPKDFDPASTAEADVQKLQPWLTTHGVDLFAKRENGKPILAISDMVIAVIDENDFDRLTYIDELKANTVWRGAVDAQNRPQVQSVTRGAYGGKTTVAFETRFNVIGVLQVVGVVSEPPGVKVRYKLVESTRLMPAVSTTAGKSGAGASAEKWAPPGTNGPSFSKKVKNAVGQFSAPPPAVKVDPSKILTEAKELAAQGQYEESLQRHIWYHNHALEQDPAQAGVRVSSALMDWVELGRKYPKAMQALVEIRDSATGKFLTREGSFTLFMDVHAINALLNENDATDALFQRIEKQDPALARQCFFIMEDRLVQSGEYERCLKWMGDPGARFDLIMKTWNAVGKMGGRVQTFAVNNFVTKSCQLIEVLNGTGHDVEAEKIRTQALAVLDDPRLRPGVVTSVRTEGQKATIAARFGWREELRIFAGTESLGWSTTTDLSNVTVTLEASETIPLANGSTGRGFVIHAGGGTFNVAMTPGGVVPNGDLVFRENGKISETNGVFTFADIRQTNGVLVPFRARVRSASPVPAVGQRASTNVPTPSSAPDSVNKDILQVRLEAAERSVANTKAQYEAGTATHIDLARAEFERDYLRAQIKGDGLLMARLKFEFADLEMNETKKRSDAGSIPISEYQRAKLARDIAELELKQLQNAKSK